MLLKWTMLNYISNYCTEKPGFAGSLRACFCSFLFLADELSLDFITFMLECCWIIIIKRTKPKDVFFSPDYSCNRLYASHWGYTSSYHARCHPPGFHQATVAHSHLPPPDHCHCHPQAAPLGGAVHCRHRHHFLCRLFPAPARHLVRLLLPLLHQFVA